MLRAGLAGRERLPVPHHSVYGSLEGDDDETFELNNGHDEGRGKGKMHRKNPSWLEHEYKLRRSLITRIVTKPCRSIKTFLLLVVGVFLVVWYFTKKVGPGATTFVFHEADTRRVWEWEIQSGHWMSWRPIKRWFHPPRNPSLPSPSEADDVEHPGGVIGCGWKRKYIHIDDLLYQNITSLISRSSLPPDTYRSIPKTSIYPPRPVPGSIVDFDIINQYCDRLTGQYLRTCLSFLQLGSHLSPPHSPLSSLRMASPKSTLYDSPTLPHYYIRSKTARIPQKPLGLPEDWRYAYLEDRMSMRAPSSEWTRYGGGRALEQPLELKSPVAPSGGVPAYTIGAGTMMVPEQEEEKEKEGVDKKKKKKNSPWDVDEEFTWAPGQCEEDYPRIVHMSWEGGFGDEPYMTLLSFLYSQNLGLDHPAPALGKEKAKGENASSPVPCRPEFWVWIREGDETWEKRASSNSWSAVFFEKRALGDIIKFRRWNTTEQMDAVPELAGWRDAVSLDLGVKQATKDHHHSSRVVPALENDLRKRSSGSSFDGPDAATKLHAALDISVADTARWLLPHRFGGVYVEPGLLFLRDWEELWNYRGAFSTRIFGSYTGTAVLRLNKGSALGTLVLRTALRHGLRLDAKSVEAYVEDAGVDQMLFPIPDMLQDLAFWSGQKYQRKRPTVPTFDSPREFFEPTEATIPAAEIGVAGFFRGAWFYHAHAHSESGMPFDIARNFAGSTQHTPSGVFGPGDRWDVSWSAVFKRTLEAFMRGEQPNMYGEWFV